MSDKVLICPAERSGVAFLTQSVPLVNLPLFGESLIHYWLEFLSSTGSRRILLLVTDRPEQVRALVGNGERWGVELEFVRELQELAPEDAAAKYGAGAAGSRRITEKDCIVLDRLPGLPDYPLFSGYAYWFEALLVWLPMVQKMPRIGCHEIRPGIWSGLRSRIAPSAELRAPCWIGEEVRIGSDAVIGPEAILENRVVVDEASEITQSVVGPETFVGSLTRLHNSIAWGNTLIDWRTGSCTHVADAFLLCSLGSGESPARGSGWVRGALERGWQGLLRLAGRSGS